MKYIVKETLSYKKPTIFKNYIIARIYMFFCNILGLCEMRVETDEGKGIWFYNAFGAKVDISDE